MRLVKEKPLGAIGGAIVLVLLFAGIFADVLAPHDYSEVNIYDRLAPPSAEHWLGADQVGRDVLSRIIHGARVSVIIGLAASTLNVTVATIVGTACGFLGGRFDLLVQRFVDAWMCFPGLLLLITVMSIVGQGITQIILVLGIQWGIGGSRITRSAVIAIKDNVYMTAATAVGCSNGRMLLRHILPNIMAPIIIMFSTSIGGVILTEASLSFLGFGLPPDVPSWGGMLSWEGRRYMELAPMLAFWPGFCLSVVVYGMNMLGDAMRDLLDPRLRGGVGGMGARGAELARKAMDKMEARARKTDRKSIN
ncbi:MAG TPA: ABC transporter permease [Dehalococcoidia bacterium]|nr:ABC transporter permease [Dehalococcoidia bacterium]